MIANAASYVNEGYNPVSFGSTCPGNCQEIIHGYQSLACSDAEYGRRNT